MRSRTHHLTKLRFLGNPDQSQTSVGIPTALCPGTWKNPAFSPYVGSGTLRNFEPFPSKRGASQQDMKHDLNFLVWPMNIFSSREKSPKRRRLVLFPPFLKGFSLEGVVYTLPHTFPPLDPLLIPLITVCQLVLIVSGKTTCAYQVFD